MNSSTRCATTESSHHTYHPMSPPVHPTRPPPQPRSVPCRSVSHPSSTHPSPASTQAGTYSAAHAPHTSARSPPATHSRPPQASLSARHRPRRTHRPAHDSSYPPTLASRTSRPRHPDRHTARAHPGDPARRQLRDHEAWLRVSLATGTRRCRFPCLAGARVHAIRSGGRRRACRGPDARSAARRERRVRSR